MHNDVQTSRTGRKCEVSGTTGRKGFLWKNIAAGFGGIFLHLTGNFDK